MRRSSRLGCGSGFRIYMEDETMKKVNHEDDHWALGKAYGMFHMTGFDYDLGDVATKYGFVTAYAQGDDERWHLTELRFCYLGRIYTRTWRDRRYSQKYMVTLARRFADEIVQDVA